MPPRKRPPTKSSRCRPPKTQNGIRRRAPTERGLFGKLPMELMLEIFGHMHYDSAIFLASTNHYFRSLVDPLSIASEEAKADFVTLAEKRKRRERDFACYGCYRLRPEESFVPFFTPEMLENHAGYLGSTPWQFCSDCTKTKPITVIHPDACEANGSDFDTSDDDSSKSNGAEESALSIKSHYGVWDCDCCLDQFRRTHPDCYPYIDHGGCPKCNHCVLWAGDLKDECPSCKGRVLPFRNLGIK